MIKSKIEEKLKDNWLRRKRNDDLAPEWSRFEDFYHWFMDHGVDLCSKISKIDRSQPLGPYNCKISTLTPAEKSRVAHRSATTERIRSQAQCWDAAVTYFRRALEQSSDQAQRNLMVRLATGNMPEEWYNCTEEAPLNGGKCLDDHQSKAI